MGIFLNINLIASLPLTALFRFLAWAAIGSFIYLFYGVRHSKLALVEYAIKPTCVVDDGADALSDGDEASLELQPLNPKSNNS